MGKSRRNRSGASRRTDPVGGRPRPVKAPADPQLAALRQAKILPVVQDLRNADPKTRTAAASAIANIVEDSRCRKLLLREQIVHVVLIETLADSGIESRAAGWAILNVLAQFEEADFCVHLFRCDVLTPAAHALGQVVETLQATTPNKAQQQFVWRITLAIVDLVGQLAEARDEIQDALATGHAAIVQALFALTAASTSLVPLEIHWAVVTCLARLCDGQRALSQTLVDDQTFGCYRALGTLTEAGGPMAVAACAVLHSVFTALEWFDHSPGRDGASDAVLVPVLSKALEQQQEKQEQEEDLQAADVLSQALQVLAMMGTTLETALEKGNRDAAALRGAKNGHSHANGDAMEADDDGSDEEEEEDSDAEMADGDEAADESKDKHDDDEDMDDIADIEADMDNVTGADGADAETSALDDLPTLQALIGTAVPAIVRVVQSCPRDADETAVVVQLDALSALNNVAWTVSCLDLADEGNAGVREVWTRAAQQIWLDVVRPLVADETTANSKSVDLRVAAQTTGLAWALARVLGGQTPAEAGEPVRFMGLRAALSVSSGSSSSGSDSDSDPFQNPAVMCIGVLGQMARDPAPVDRNAPIGEYLLDIVEALPETPAAEAVEALDQFFDLYRDENAACDGAVFWPRRFLERLEAAVPKAKAMAKTIDKRTQDELRTRADEVVLNMGRLIQYKKKHRP